MQKLPKWILYSVILFAALTLVIVTLFPPEERFAWIVGYLMGIFAVALHYISSLFSYRQPDKDFLRVYYISIFVRFLIVCALFVLVLILTKIEVFSFTVSLIISYIFHSVNEVIHLNQKLSE
ncbi:MAG: hypothetical protein GVY02_07040 [Bacteroidetes bacterium]|jgi:hypothetical protein|nr:hypothetical protein [Bacteroidota bacterium]